ncbi:MAG TPA: 4-hydroxythreonine-4-phosphate dehydrogenase PdxA [Xanthobacteraceae bacterium]|nr:4-hydroxythreonine-4-phosphate dehydrogenase PdxA [Xanthobacteraceae bacterium]
MRPLALTLGEPAGIGPELTLALWARRKSLGVPAFVAVGDPALLASRARLLSLDVPLVECEADTAASRFANALPVLSTGVAATAAPGKPDRTSAASVRAAIERAVKLVETGKAAALVTNPISKSVLYAAGFEFPGHTEYLARLAAKDGKAAPRPVMMLWCEELAVVPATIHVPLKDVPALLSADLIVETGRIVARELARRFGVARPRLAVCGLNPHAGEGGSLGREEIEIISPAIGRLSKEGIEASGPHPADTLFHPEARKRFDAVIGMYHDQVLAPIKTIAFDRAVNVTLGLPFVRTSPDHGTAFDIAGSGRANPASLLAALKLAERLATAEATVAAK